MASNDEYQQRNFFKRRTKWVSVKDMWPNPKTVHLTGTTESVVLWFKRRADGTIEQANN